MNRKIELDKFISYKIEMNKFFSYRIGFNEFFLYKIEKWDPLDKSWKELKDLGYSKWGRTGEMGSVVSADPDLLKWCTLWE